MPSIQYSPHGLDARPVRPGLVAFAVAFLLGVCACDLEGVDPDVGDGVEAPDDGVEAPDDGAPGDEPVPGDDPVPDDGSASDDDPTPGDDDPVPGDDDPAPGDDDPAPGDVLYRQTGSDPSWDEVLASGNLPLGENSDTGFEGSVIDVNNELVEVGPHAETAIPRNIRIHTVGNSSIPRSEFDRWSRWYQEDGNTQVFRLFPGEENVRNERGLAARIEAWGGLKFSNTRHEWTGRYTIVEAAGCARGAGSQEGCAIFQSKGNIDQWSVQINLHANGDIILNHRRGTDRVIARNMVGKSFDLRVVDDGTDYRVFLDGASVGAGTFERSGETTFRWGIYVGANEVTDNVMIFVTGASRE